MQANSRLVTNMTSTIPKNIDTLIYAKHILPVEPKNIILAKHAIAIDKGEIIEVLPQDLADKSYNAKQTIRLNDHALMPGFINCHTHSPMTLLRGIADDLPLMEWLEKHIWPREQKFINEEFIQDGTLLAIAEMLRSGTTCFNEHYFYPETIMRVAIQAGMRCRIGVVVMDVPTPWAQDAKQYLQKGLSFIKNHNHPLIDVSMAPHAPYTVNDNTFLEIKAIADEHNLPIHIHMHESKHEIDTSLQQYQKRPLQRLYDLGLVSDKLQNVHMTQITDADIKILQQTKAHVITCPESNLKLASGFCPIYKLQQAGINIAIGTDGAASNNDLDILQEIRTASLLAKAVATDATAIPAPYAIKMATINGAKALHLDHKIGSLVPGKQADIIAINLNDIATLPTFNAMSQIIYSANQRQITDVWVAGNRLLDNGEFTTISEDKIKGSAQKWQERL